jgi:UDP-glucuronate 4-epimerase
MNIDVKKVLVTGSAGFIGFYLAKKLLEDNFEVVGLDNLSPYYDPGLKKARLSQLTPHPRYSHVHLDLDDRDGMAEFFSNHSFDVVVNLAAQAGVRYSLKNPHSYVDTNIVGFVNLLEGCRHSGVKHFVFASSSSVYGANTKIPFSVHHNVDHPVSLYAASKKSNELMAHSYAHLYDLAVTGLRFFTVYGPWGLPDRAYFLFSKAILEDRPIDVFNHGRMARDFTYIDDIIDGVYRVIHHRPEPDKAWDGNDPDPATSYCRYKIYNIGNNQKVDLLRFIEILEKCLGKEAKKNFLPMQPGDVPQTFADIDDLIRDVGFRPTTPIEEGLKRFVAWYREYYKIAI